MKAETMLKRALEIKDEKIRLARLESICFKVLPRSEIWERAHEEAQRLRSAGVRY